MQGRKRTPFKTARDQFYFGGCSSPCSQPVALSDLSGSGPSHSKHWNVRCPLPPGGSARIKKAPQWGQVGRSACPMEEFVAERILPEHDCSPKETQYFYGDGVSLSAVGSGRY